MKPSLKHTLTQACSDYVDARIARFNSTMKELEEALKPESRSCMGDKYETSRAMLHLEFEKLTGQVEQFTALRKTVNAIDSNSSHSIIAFGSIVKTSEAGYFLCIPAGEILVEGEKFYAVGINAPVAQAIMGKKKGERFVFNGKTAEILFVE
ncbi:hypothetical protein BH23BAC2_BH23BAC2_05240 [soil metagenome]